MAQLILIFIGGGLGSVARFLVNRSFQNIVPQPSVYGTLLANLIASLVLGIFVGWATLRQPAQTDPLRALVAVGFCGGFSTFSTFSNDTLHLFQTNRTAEALLNIFVNVAGCLALTLAGVWAGKQLL